MARTTDSNVDVLIVGAGPAGLVMAAWMATCGDRQIFNGQADAINMRTMEIFYSLGFADRDLKEGNPLIELNYVVIAKSCSGIRVERGVLPTKLEIDDALVGSLDAYPITVHLRQLSEIESSKYVVGADGAHSWVRQELGFSLEGESTDYVWGVLDMVPITDFPDIRTLCTIQSTDSGSILVKPRENKLVRLYIQLTTTAYNGGKRADRSKINPDAILKAAQKILAPYQLSYRKLNWWTAYQVGQRVGTRFSAHDRVCLAGDAIHTHSPKVGQGMNVSMQDSYNFGWKVASVVKGLKRRGTAQNLITYDYWFSLLLSDHPAPDNMMADLINPANMKEACERYNLFLAGCSVDYGPSMIVTKEDKRSSVTSIQELAPEMKIGMRVPSVKVLNQADGWPWHPQQRLPSDGRWRVVVYAGDVTKQAQKEKLEILGAAIGSKESFLQRFTPAEARYDAFIEILIMHAAPRKQLDIFEFPDSMLEQNV
ncbi:FAD binding domain-containing protein [Aspergillus filifer]